MNYQKYTYSNRAFSLVELSIVLVILGLLTGGILAGQSLIRAVELRSVVADYQRYSAAMQSFRDKYLALPGDMSNATKFWGVQNPTPATCRTTASTTIATCDGDGNGSIADSTGSVEWFRAWQQLANAGLVEGSYNGIAGSVGIYDWDFGRNAPRSKISNAGCGIQPFMNAGAAAASPWPAVNIGNAFWFASEDDNINPDGPVLKPEEAWNLDTKLDDGKPASGSIVSGFVGTCTDSTDATLITANYNLISSTNSCFLVFKIQ